MSNPEFTPPTYTLPEGSLELLDMPRDHGLTPLYSPQGHPEIVAREPYETGDSAENTRMEQLTECLFRLSTEYGIDFPGVGSTVPEEIALPDGRHSYRTFTATAYVAGVSMRYAMEDIPPDVTADTLDKMIHYHEDVARDTSGQLYFTDLFLRQCIYGKRRDGDPSEAPKPYYVDLGRSPDNITTPNKYDFADSVNGLVWELMTLRRKFPEQNIDDLATRMATLGENFDIFVPYYG